MSFFHKTTADFCYVGFTCPGLFTSVSLDTGQSLAGMTNLHASGVYGALPMKL